MTAILLDWENYSIALRCAGYSLRPVDAVRALLKVLTHPDEPVELALVTTSATPPACDRAEVLSLHRGRVAVKIHTAQNLKPDAADIELAFLAGREVERSEPRKLVVVSADRDLVQVADLAASVLDCRHEANERLVTLAYVRRPRLEDPRRKPRRPPDDPLPSRAAATEILSRFGSSDIALSTHRRRSANDYDRAAWGLARAIAGGQGRADEAICLHSDRLVERKPYWWDSLADYDSLQALEDVDDVLWLISDSFIQSPMRIRPDEMTAKLVSRAERLSHAIEPIVEALITADLVRIDLDGNVVPRMPLHEGLLFPARRVVLSLATVADMSRRRSQLRKLHCRSRNYRKLETQDEVSLSWGMVTRLLSNSRWKVLTEQSSEGIPCWTLDHEQQSLTRTFARNALEETRRILQVVDGSAGVTERQVTAALGGPVRYSRWLYTMSRVGLLVFEPTTRTYRRGPAQLFCQPD